jgi:peptide/nickel transport system substrate-binding protein
MKCLKLVVAIAIITVFLMPTLAFAYSGNPADYQTYEQWGPRVNEFLMKFYSSADVEFQALALGDIDIVEWPLTKTYYNQFIADPNIAVVGAGAEYGMYIMDFNNNETLPDGTHNPLSDPAFRHALWHLIDREYIASDIFEGMSTALYSPVAPAAGSAWINPAVVNAHPFSITDANNLLEAAGYTIDSGTGKRIDPATGQVITLKVYGRSDHAYRAQTATWFSQRLDDVHVGYTLILKTSSGCSLDVMTNKDFSTYTGGWSLGIDVPDSIYALFHSSMYWHPGKPPNYGHYSDPIADALIEQAWYAGSLPEAISPTLQWQARYIDPAWVPAPTLVANIIYMAHRKNYGTYSGEEAYAGLPFKDIFNSPGRGIGSYSNFYTFMNVYPQDGALNNMAPGNYKIRWGWKVAAADKLNPVYGSWVWDWAVMNWIYDTLMGINPQITTEDRPWMAYQYNLGTWDNPDNPAFPKSTFVTFKLRDDIYWQDGVHMTLEDFRWMVGREPGDLIPTVEARGIEYPWWYSSIADIHHVEVIDDWTIKIYYNIRSYLALHWLGGLPLIPKHIWKPLFDTGDPTIHLADPTLTGNGPFKFVTYVENAGAKLTRNNNYFRNHPIDERCTKWATWTGAPAPGYAIWDGTQWINPITHLPITPPATASIWKRVILYNYADEPMTVTLTVDGLPPDTVTVPKAGGNGAYPGTADKVFGPFDHEPTKTSSYTYHGWTITQTEDYYTNTIPEDTNIDQTVNFKDAIILGAAFGSKPGDLNWDLRADIKRDGVVNYLDAIKLGAFFGWPNWKPT